MSETHRKRGSFHNVKRTALRFLPNHVFPEPHAILPNRGFYQNIYIITGYKIGKSASRGILAFQLCIVWFSIQPPPPSLLPPPTADSSSGVTLVGEAPRLDKLGGPLLSANEAALSAAKHAPASGGLGAEPLAENFGQIRPFYHNVSEAICRSSKTSKIQCLKLRQICFEIMILMDILSRRRRTFWRYYVFFNGIWSTFALQNSGNAV